MQGRGGGCLQEKTICYHVLHLWNFDLLTPSPRVVGGVGSAGKTYGSMMLHSVIPLYDHDHVLKKLKLDLLKFDLLTPSTGSGDLQAKYAAMLLHS